MKTTRAQYTPQGDAPTEPAPGCSGEAREADGYHDPTSAQRGAWLFKPDGDDRTFYVNEEDLTFAEPTKISRASYRKPDGIFARSLAGVALIRQTRIKDALAAIKPELLKAATNIAQHLGTQATGGAAHRIGMPEALYLVLDGCGDHEAARLACESFLERNRRPADTAPAFGEYRDFMIEPNTATGEGWIVYDGERNMMPNGETFESVTGARAAVDLLYDHGLRITDDFLAECSPLLNRSVAAA
jgi:hypothetical protein